MKRSLVAFIVCGLIIIACSKGNDIVTAVDCSGAAKSYATDIMPIIQAYCAIGGCHASGSSNGPGALSTYQQVFNNRSAIRTAVANGSMPQNTTLSATQKNSILCWIDSGSSNN